MNVINIYLLNIYANLFYKNLYIKIFVTEMHEYFIFMGKYIFYFITH